MSAPSLLVSPNHPDQNLLGVSVPIAGNVGPHRVATAQSPAAVSLDHTQERSLASSSPETFSFHPMTITLRLLEPKTIGITLFKFVPPRTTFRMPFVMLLAQHIPFCRFISYRQCQTPPHNPLPFARQRLSFRTHPARYGYPFSIRHSAPKFFGHAFG